ncbi:hypothetical protein FSP39_012401 [Pinctada imbricata]|uniref:G-protein coupled receptors family 1 profile domain-containing protein n=1 Tax=Pinctada imbricata TaxID=66713 RepID=A0AA89BUJ7_PINIB|nr:hypothetical protein FSP39_012401 [Pinctada imbricata]
MASNNSSSILQASNLIFIANDAGYGALEDQRLMAIFVVATFLFLISLLGNFFTLITLCINKSELKNPTYVAIWCLSFTDIIAVMSRFVAIQGAYFIDFDSCWSFMLVFTSALTFMNCSAGQVVILSAVRFCMIRFPIQSLTLREKARTYIPLFSATNWIINIAIACGYGSHKYDQCVELGLNPRDYVTEAIWVTAITVVPLVTIGVLHVLKLRAMAQAMTSVNKQSRMMSMMVTLIAVVYIVSILPSFITQVLYFCNLYGVIETLGYWFTVLSVTATMFLFLNLVSNPLIFFMFSIPARRALRTLAKNVRAASRKFSMSKSSESTRTTVSMSLSD